MIDLISFGGKKLRFYNESVDLEENVFTTIVGKNGSGKSRLLANLISKCISKRNNESEAQRQIDLFDSFDLPPSVIAVSTSPFDRFPISGMFNNRSNNIADSAVGYYYYLGIRGLWRNDLGMSYMVRTISGLIRALTADAGRIRTVLNVLDYLGFESSINASFVCSIAPTTLARLAEAEDPLKQMMEWTHANRAVGADFKRALFKLSEQSDELKLQVVDSIRYYLDIKKNGVRDKSFSLVISREGIFNEVAGDLISDRFLPMMEIGMLRLRRLELHKREIAKPFHISDASSGEQCIVLGMLGIASQIKDGALICIDEPEICLHPEWQERYIDILMSTFKNFKRCHFIIATHSPQIVSRLNSKNCYILDMQSSKLLDAASSNRRSVDYQLANIFSAPGYKNEYLMREILNLVSKLSAGQTLDESDHDIIYKIGTIEHVLEKSDPVLQLYSLVKRATSGGRADG